MSTQTDHRSARAGGRHTSALVVAGLGAALVLGACSVGGVQDVAARGPLDGQSLARNDGGGGGNGGGNGGGGYGNGGGGYTGGNTPGSAGAEDHATGTGDGLAPRIEAFPVATLTAAEVDALMQMREEEKLAHDVYVALGDTWGSRVFENIARAETTHGDAVKTLLDRYGLQDPAAGMVVGEFADPQVQALYDELVARGRTSLTEAFTVGALIEDLDIRDLRDLATDTPDVALVFGDLERGSQNHLRAFVRNLDRLGATYTPTYLSAGELESILGA